MKVPDLHDLEIAGVHAWHGDVSVLATAAAAAKLMELYAAGKIKPLISARVPLAEAPKALAMVAGGKSTGKVILTI